MIAFLFLCLESRAGHYVNYVDKYARQVNDFHVVKGGGAPSQALLDEVQAIGNAPLGEELGEAYHRGTHLTLIRGPASSQYWAMASTRHNEALATCQRFTRQGDLGKRVARFEWTHHKRLLQARAHNAWTPVKKNDADYYRLLYRIDGFGNDDWESIIPEGKTDQRDLRGSGVGSEAAQALQNEYVKAVFRPRSFYSIPVAARDANERGEPQAKQESCYFQCLGVESGSSRPKLTPTAFDSADQGIHARIALTVQYLSLWRKEGNASVCFFDSDAEHLNVFDVASYNTIKNEMLLYKDSPSDVYGCIDLTDPHPAVPIMPLTDPLCPILTLVEAVRAEGWRPVGKKVTHSNDARDFDGRECGGRRRYLQCLLNHAQVVAANCIVSQQPLAYYDVALRGQKVIVGLPAKEYTRQLGLIRDGLAVNALVPIETPPLPLELPALPDGSDDDFDVGGGPAAPESKALVAKRTVAKAKQDRPAALKNKSSSNSSSSSAPPSKHSRSTSRSSNSSSDSSSDSDAFDVGGGKRGKVGDWVTLEDVPLQPRMKLDTFKPHGKKLYRRFILSCQHHPSDTCSKKRNVTIGIPGEAIAYLIAWHEGGGSCASKKHKDRAFKVKQDRVDFWFARLGTRLKALHDELTG